MVYIHFAEGFEEIEAISTVDVLRRAEIPVKTVSVTGTNNVTGGHGITVQTDLLFEEVDYNNASMIILPGGMPGASNLEAHEGLKKQILAFAEKNKPIGAVCAAPYVLGKLGVLNGKKAVCYPGYETHLKGADVGYSPAVIDGNIVTGRGPGPAIKFALKIVELLKSKDIADQVAKKMLVE